MENEVLDKNIYSKSYDYEDLKTAICVSNFFNNWCINNVDYEDIALLTIEIKESWLELNSQGKLTEEEFAYPQRYASNYLIENKYEILRRFFNGKQRND